MAFHAGPTRLVIAIDVGATCSSVAYQYLQHGAPVPLPTDVNNWPGDGQRFHQVKVLSCILYKDRKPVAFGPDAVDKASLDVSEDSVLIENFKLAWHPEYMRNKASPPVTLSFAGALRTFERPDIPSWLSMQDLYRDYLNFLIGHTKTCFIGARANGAQLWPNLLQDAHWIIGAPNGWDPTLREATKRALAATDYCQNSKQITVVSEAEASLFYLLHTVNNPVPLDAGSLFTICDAGGSTVDITLYRCTKTGAHSFVEVGASDCLQKGGLYPSRILRQNLSNMFRVSSKFGASSAKCAQAAINAFDEILKTKWDGTHADGHTLQFSHNLTDADLAAGINRGRILVSSERIKAAFDYSVLPIIERLKAKISDENGNRSKAILLVGGFGDSPYLQRVLRETFQDVEDSIPVVVPAPSEPGEKAVSAGGVYVYGQRDAIQGRGSLFYYGTNSWVLYDPTDREHKKRPLLAGVDRQQWVANKFTPLIRKNDICALDEYKQTEKYCLEWEDSPTIPYLSVPLFLYTRDEEPAWMSNKSGRWSEGFVKVGRISCHPGRLPVKTITKADGTMSYEIEFRIGISFGDLDIRARIESIDGSFKSIPMVFKANCITPYNENDDGNKPKRRGQKGRSDLRLKYYG